MMRTTGRKTGVSLRLATWLLLVPGVLLTAGPAVAVWDAGGVLLLHADDSVPFELGRIDYLPDTLLQGPDEARARLPGDGRPHMVLVYAAFSPDSVGEVYVISFGIRYSRNVKVLGRGPLRNTSLETPQGRWPASDQGIIMAFEPHQLGVMIPIYWFSVSAKGPGFFEVTPHPLPSLSGTFVTADLVPHEEPISGYGRIGFELEGSVPVPGPRPEKGACCMEGCWFKTRGECEFYRGTFLGEGVPCNNWLCGPAAPSGACCLGSGCEPQSRLDCARLGGLFLGEAIPCDSISCPRPGEPIPKIRPKVPLAAPPPKYPSYMPFPDSTLTAPGPDSTETAPPSRAREGDGQ